ncbi:MAG: hypothetical protein HUK25_02595 [Treponema sp.]|nr:hypothetical protein [Treponema sp.]
MINIINSTFENSLRIVLLLSKTPAALRQERIVYLDFITCYSKDFGFTENINGRNSVKKSELALRRKKIQKALQELVVDGFVCPKDTDEGLFYQITQDGRIYSEKLSSEYAGKYRIISESVISHFENNTDKELLDLILKGAGS